MASIVLSAAGSAIGTATGLPFGAALGARLGQTLGGFIGGSLGGGITKFRQRGPRLTDLGVQTSTYGKMIPIVYGISRIGGNIIWSRPIKELVTTTTSSSSGGGKGGGGRVSQSTSTFSYSISLAIGICEGAVNDVLRVWADAKQLDLSQFNVRIYKGTEDQLPDSLIQSFEGINSTPAHRGLAYVVFEDFSLADFGNRIPNFTFEVQKKLLHPDYNSEILEDVIQGVVVIPGAGEFVYDTQIENKIPGVQTSAGWVQQGDQQSINMHNPNGIANSLLSLDQLESTCPNVSWISVVVGWFGDNMDAGLCVVKPGVEFKTGGIITPDDWQVGSYDRNSAPQITLVDGRPQYGGTPDDDSIIRYLDELKSRGHNIIFYPFLFMDVANKPWRGNITGSAADVASFFTKTDGFNEFILHYANLVKDKVDAFVIASEFKGLTAVTDVPGNYPAVNELVSLAASVKTIMGAGVKVTYAADWSEYHHDAGGWYNLDPLWASPDIDFIGIDAYFPLSDSVNSIYDIDELINGWTSGEGYDWFYSDPERTVQTPLTPAFAWKNIDWFWNNVHVNPDLSPTSWVPQSKKIWFTEYGFPSVDAASNQPNVFFDPNSVSSAFPYLSRGRIDFRAQRAALMATQQKWKNSTMVEQMFIWSWDARPFPYWPDLTSVWSDGSVWKTGHWIQGKLGISSLAAIVSDLNKRAGLLDADFDVSNITEQVEGYVISDQQTIRNCVETLKQGYFFDVVESDNILKFVARGGDSAETIIESDLIPQGDNNNNEIFKITRAQEIELPKRVNVVYINRLTNYQSSTQYSQREVTTSKEILSIDLSVVFPDQMAKIIADKTLFTEWIGRTTFEFDVPVQYALLEPTDIITVMVSGVEHRMRIISTQRLSSSLMRISAIADDISTYDFYTPPGESPDLLLENNNIPVTGMELVDTAAMPGDDVDKGYIRIAAVGLSTGWNGAALYRSDDNGASYGRIQDLSAPSVIGSCNAVLGIADSVTFDEANTVEVSLLANGDLQSANDVAVLNGANAALLGDEIIQFRTATFLESGKYLLSGLLRGRLGTEWAIGLHQDGEPFILLDGRITRQIAPSNIIALPRKYKAVTFGSTLALTPENDFTYNGAALKPYSPVHIAGVRDGSNNLTITWVRRTRLGESWQDFVDVPLNESSETYEVEIFNGANVVRLISGLNSPSATYSAADQIADFGSVQTNVSVKVYQLSAVVGRGYPGVNSV